MLANIEKSGIYSGEYVGFARNDIYRITKINSVRGKWQATGGLRTEVLFSTTLERLDKKLESSWKDVTL